MKSKFLTIFLIFVILGVGFSACSETPVEDPLTAEGAKIYKANCLSCHPIDPSQPRVGPDLVGLSKRLTANGIDAAGFFDESIREPGKETTEGFQDLMPAASLLGLSDEDINALILYLDSLSSEDQE